MSAAAAPGTSGQIGQKTSAKNKAADVVQNVFVKQTQVMISTLSVNHIEALMKRYQHADEFTSKLSQAKLPYFRRLIERLPLMEADFVCIVVKSINVILKSKQKDEWMQNILDTIDSFIIYQVVRLYSVGKLNEGILNCLKGCEVINNNKIFRKFVLRM